jgi:streptomycin 6-kinase
VAGVLNRLWKPPREGHLFRLLADAAARWAEELPRGWDELGRPYEEPLLEEAVAFLREAASAQGEQVVLHQDLHGGNILQALREPWLAIDPKPLVGEREFDTASFLRDRRWELRNDPDAGARVRRRLDLLAAQLDLDRDRMRGWGIAHALAWGMSGKSEQDRDMADCARWLAAA